MGLEATGQHRGRYLFLSSLTISRNASATFEALISLVSSAWSNPAVKVSNYDYEMGLMSRDAKQTRLLNMVERYINEHKDTKIFFMLVSYLLVELVIYGRLHAC